MRIDRFLAVAARARIKPANAPGCRAGTGAGRPVRMFQRWTAPRPATVLYAAAWSRLMPTPR